MTMLAVVLVVGLLIGGGVGWFMKPAEVVGGGDGEVVTVTEYQHPFKDKEVQIGYISSSASGLETMEPFLETIIEPDINEYIGKLGYGTSYNFVIDQADSQAAIHLEKVQSFKSMGLEVFIACFTGIASLPEWWVILGLIWISMALCCVFWSARTPKPEGMPRMKSVSAPSLGILAGTLRRSAAMSSSRPRLWPMSISIWDRISSSVAAGLWVASTRAQPGFLPSLA